MPSIVIKKMRQKFDQQWTARKSTMTDESERILSLVHSSQLALEARVEGSTVYFEDLLALQEGDVLQFDTTLEQPVVLRVNGLPKYLGDVMISNGRRGFAVAERVEMGSVKV